MSLDRRADYASRAAQRLTEAFRGKLRAQGLAAAVGAEAQLLEDVAIGMLVADAVDDATDAELDLLGEYVGQPREWRTDAHYRAWIRARLVVIHADGLEEDLIAVVRAVAPSGVSVRVESEYPAAVTVHAMGAPIDLVTGEALAQILQVTKSAGVRLLFHWSDATSGAFRLSTTGWTGAATLGARGFGLAPLSAVSDGHFVPPVDIAANAVTYGGAVVTYASAVVTYTA